MRTSTQSTRQRKPNSIQCTPLDTQTCKQLKAYSKAHSWQQAADLLYSTPRSITVLAQGRLNVSFRMKRDINTLLSQWQEVKR
jgi:hypothetical protein